MAEDVDSLFDMQTIIDAIPNPIFVKNRSYKIVLLNNSACALFGHSRESLLGRPEAELFSLRELAIFHTADDLVFNTGEERENQELVTDGAGRIHHVITRKRLAKFHGVEYLVASVTDVSASREVEAENRHLAFHDALTGLPNRTLLKERLEEALSLGSGGCALLYIDLDRFKEINDSHGHPVGDELIQQFARRLSEIVRTSDTVARLGGDEFAILLSNGHLERTTADELCRRVLAAAESPFQLTGVEIKVGASIGVAFASNKEINQSELQRRADVALYEAKKNGKGRFHIFTPALDERVRRQQALQTELRYALASGSGLDLYYQPIVCIGTGQVEGFEALSRWQHRELGNIQPSEFIPVAETSGLIIELGERVLIRACETASAWDLPLRISVNVSPVQFSSGDLAHTVEQSLRRSGLAPERLELEITESVLIKNPKLALLMLNRIRALGVHIALDDFGVGYSSLCYFRQFPFDRVKIDRTFIADIIESSQARSIVQAVISLGRGLDLQVVAEGVETHQQLAILTKQGCTHVQGHLFGRPMPISHFVESVFGDQQKNGSRFANA
jgi:diguanylate cyclase (GGDEF)-like protein/PAS domain S-box-containing protein